MSLHVHCQAESSLLLGKCLHLLDSVESRRGLEEPAGNRLGLAS